MANENEVRNLRFEMSALKDNDSAVHEQDCYRI